ncbi:hypothetical protein FA95DRAFT_1613732 [Auriscalpium vulgare]|uniref:Uncharacterized protein n=1 Tax=Auriscalpium vulgare TaxID=40419 RepID=A0ACB8R267_9AGAM|nr:hypothetical protein FA95DRAFT_1613732 [Auriscalpium vulgare]
MASSCAGRLTRFAVTALQTWHYYLNYPQDPWHLKAIVAVVFVCDTLQQIFVAHTGYWYLITHYFEPQFLGHMVWSFLVCSPLTSVVSLIVQCFYIRRIWKLSMKNLIVVGILSALAFTQLLGTTAYFSRACKLATQSDWLAFTYIELKKIEGLSIATNAITAVADTAMALVLCYYLRRSRTGFKRSDTVITKLTIFAVNTGLITSINAVCSVVTVRGSYLRPDSPEASFHKVAALPKKLIYMAIWISQSRLYSNSLMASLNVRKYLRNQIDSDGIISLSAIQGARQSAASAAPPFDPLGIRSQANNVAIRIDTTRYNDGDTNKDIKFNDRKENDTVSAA